MTRVRVIINTVADFAILALLTFEMGLILSIAVQ